MRVSTIVLIASALMAVALAGNKSCLVHCENDGDCGCQQSNCEGVYCENGCGTPCPTCTVTGQAQGAKYGGCIYGAGVPQSFEDENCPTSGSYCGYCECSTVDGHSTGWLDECCRYDCSNCAVAGCPAEKLTCAENCVPNSNTDDSNCCYCDCEDGDPCTINEWDSESQSCQETPACPPVLCNEPECVVSNGEASCVDRPLVNTKCVDTEDLCKVGSCLNLQCVNLGDRDCSDGNDCTDDSCESENGCINDPKADGVDCDDNDKCTDESVCSGGECVGQDGCDDGEVCTAAGCQSSNFALVGAGAAGAAICAAVAAAGLLNRRGGDEEDSESWAKMSSGSSYGNKRMTTATQMSSFTRGGGAGDRSSRGSRSSRSSKGKRMTGITQMSGASRGDMMGLEGASSGSRATMGTVASQMSRATRSTSGSRNSRSSRGSRNSRSSKGRSHASQGTRSSGSRNSRSSRGRH